VAPALGDSGGSIERAAVECIIGSHGTSDYTDPDPGTGSARRSSSKAASFTRRGTAVGASIARIAARCGADVGAEVRKLGGRAAADARLKRLAPGSAALAECDLLRSHSCGVVAATGVLGAGYLVKQTPRTFYPTPMGDIGGVDADESWAPI